jgi:hypothetical protein
MTPHEPDDAVDDEQDDESTPTTAPPDTPADGDASAAADGDARDVDAIVSPDQIPLLDRLEADDRVTPLEDDRYVVSTEPAPEEGGGDDAGRSGAAAGEGSRAPGPPTSSRTAPSAATPEGDRADEPPGTAPGSHAGLQDCSEAYAISIAAKTERGVAETTVASNDIRETFT